MPTRATLHVVAATVSGIAALLLSACSSGSGGGGSGDSPGEFNAVDSTLSCPAGQIGWDFSTGGGAGQVLKAPSDGIHIVQATFGANNGDVVAGNWTSKFQSVCDDNITCTRLIFDPTTDFSTNPGKGNSFNVQYTCGAEPTVYATNLAPGAGGNNPAVTLTCGAPLSIVHASYGPSDVTPVAPYLDNYTAKAANQCSGLRRCELANTNNSLFGSSPASGREEWTFQYYCGQDTTHLVTSVFYDGTDLLDFQCPATQQIVGGATLNVLQATFGANYVGRGGSPKTVFAGNWNSDFQTSCNGQVSCARPVFLQSDTDPYPGQQKAFSLEYQCSAAEPPVKMAIPGDAGSISPSLECDPPMTIVSATYGTGLASQTGNLTARAQALCPQGVRRCRFDNFGTGPFANDGTFGPVTGDKLFGPNFPPGATKTATFNYTCASDPTVQTRTFLEPSNVGEAIDFHCPLGQQELSAASGLQIDSATYGTNCVSATTTITPNNASSAVVQACLGKSNCSAAFNPGFDPAPGCAKDLEITYHCGYETTTQTLNVTSEAQGKTINLSCAPIINVQDATYGGSCSARLPADAGGLTGNETALFQESCNGTRGTCAHVLPTLPVDPAPNCAKDFSIDYTCGDDPTVKTQTVAGEAAGKTVSLSCPTPANGYAFEACVAQSCTGNQRRDAKLNCVVDNSLSQLPGFASASPITITATDVNLPRFPVFAAGTTFQFYQDQAVQIGVSVSLASTPSAAVTQVKAPSSVTNVVLWAQDTFVLTGGPAAVTPATPLTVNAFRCIVLNAGLTWDGKALSNPSPTANSVSPACFGDDTVPSWVDGARSLGTDEANFRAKYERLKTSVVASFDDQGTTVALRNATSYANALAPNPIGFFYNSSRVWENFVGYYQQTQVQSFPAVFGPSHQLLLTATGATLRSAQITVPRVTSPDVPIDLDFSWSKFGDVPGVNPFSPTTPPLASNVQTIAQRNLGATVEIAAFEDYAAVVAAAQNPQVWVPATESMLVDDGTNASSNPYRDALLLPGAVSATASGKSTHLTVKIPLAVKARIMAPSTTTVNGGGYGWLRSPIETLRMFAVRVCMNMDDPMNATATIGSGAAATSFTAQFVTPCFVLPTPLMVTRDLEARPLDYAASSAFSDSGTTDNKGDTSQATGNDTSSMSGCGTTATMAPTGTPTTTSCRDHSSLLSNGLATTGSFAREIFDTSFSTDANPNSGTFTIMATAMGYTVLDIDTPIPEVSDPDGFDHEIKFSPAYDVIAEALEDTAGKEPEPIKPNFEVEKVHAGDQGLGIGIEASGHVLVGPVPLEVSLSAGIGVGVSLSFSWDNPKGPKCSTTSPTAPECFFSNAGPKSQSDAKSDCEDQGGRLAEAVTATQWNGIVAALGTTPTAPASWIGAQAGLNYSHPDCITLANPPASCNLYVITNYEWLTTTLASGLPAAFAQLENNSGTTYLPQNGATTTTPPVLSGQTNPYFGGPYSALALGTTFAPAQAGVGVRKTNNVVTLAPISYGNGSTPTTAPYICEFPPEGSDTTTFRSSISASLEGAAGVAASVCFPDSTAGICLAAEINFIEASLTASYTVSDTLVFAPDNSKAVSQNGETDFEVTWNVDFLSGGISAELHLVFLTISWDLFHYDGVVGFAGTLFDNKNPYSVVYK